MDLKHLNSIHFLNKTLQVPLKENCYYTFAYNDQSGGAGPGGELSYCLVKRSLKREQIPSSGGSDSSGLFQQIEEYVECKNLSLYHFVM